jgi:hypothetical protein
MLPGGKKVNRDEGYYHLLLCTRLEKLLMKRSRERPSLGANIKTEMDLSNIEQEI